MSNKIHTKLNGHNSTSVALKTVKIFFFFFLKGALFFALCVCFCQKILFRISAWFKVQEDPGSFL